MDSTQNCACWHINRRLIISIFLLLVSRSTHLRFMAEGARVISSKLTEAAPARLHIIYMRGHVLEENEAGVVVNARQIGSKPPRCESRCSACGHCVAVQVPVSPKVQGHIKIRSHGSVPASTRTRPKDVAYSRGDDITNYKPISWKCKCGDLLFDP